MKAKATTESGDGGVSHNSAAPQANAEEDFIGFGSDSDADDAGVAVTKDHTAELLKGFESSSEDEEEPSTKTDEGDGGIADSAIPSAPRTAVFAAESSRKKKEGDEDDDPPITLYIGRIPHGFYTHQMRAYFSQFGDINHLRLARNRKTGAYKHFGFIEFASGEVGRIVQKTMNKYLLMGHILQVDQVPEARLEEFKKKGIDLWKGEGSRFKQIPWLGLQRGQLKSATREQWDKRVEKERKRRRVKEKKFKEMGYEFEMPEVVGVESVPVRNVDVDVLEDSVDKGVKVEEAVEVGINLQNDNVEDDAMKTNGAEKLVKEEATQ